MGSTDSAASVSSLAPPSEIPERAGHQTGKSLVEADKTDIAKSALAKAKPRGVKFLLPTDDVVATPVKTDKLDKKGKPVIEYQNVRVSTD